MWNANSTKGGAAIQRQMRAPPRTRSKQVIATARPTSMTPFATKKRVAVPVTVASAYARYPITTGYSTPRSRYGNACPPSRHAKKRPGTSASASRPPFRYTTSWSSAAAASATSVQPIATPTGTGAGVGIAVAGGERVGGHHPAMLEPGR